MHDNQGEWFHFPVFMTAFICFIAGAALIIGKGVE